MIDDMGMMRTRLDGAALSVEGAKVKKKAVKLQVKNLRRVVQMKSDAILNATGAT